MRKQISCRFPPCNFCSGKSKTGPFEHVWALLNRSRFNLHLGQWKRRSQIPAQIDISRPALLHFAAKDSDRTRMNIYQSELSLISALIAPTFFCALARSIDDVHGKERKEGLQIGLFMARLKGGPQVW